jgi:CheY-like chemotaxis protein
MARVLIVDDNADIAQVTSRLVTSMGHAVEVVTAPSRFMKTYLLFEPEIILLDIVMPEVDGLEIVRWLANVNYAGRIVLMSGSEKCMDLAGRLAAAHLCMRVSKLPKPFQLNQLERVIFQAAA